VELCDPSYPGIYIDPQTLNEYTFEVSALGSFEGRAFISATRACLARIRSGAIGGELLTLISKRCQGIGTSAGLTCRILFGRGTATNRHGRFTPGRYARTASHRTSAFPDLDYTQPEDVVRQQMARQHRVLRTVRGVGSVMTAGKGTSAAVSFNPLINYDPATFTLMLVENPAFVALAHELVHALHTLSGDVIKHEDPAKENLIEEARTVGAGKYAGTRFSENAIRAEHGYAVRTFYVQVGDCDAAALA